MWYCIIVASILANIVIVLCLAKAASRDSRSREEEEKNVFGKQG